MDIEISPEVNHLLKMINYLFMQNKLNNLVGVDKKVSYDEEKEVLTVLLRYVLYDADTKTASVIFRLNAEVDPQYFYDIESTFIRDLNDKFFAEVLMHTDFTTAEHNDSEKFKIGQN